MEAAERTKTEPTEAIHLCVLVHGLWGNPDHLAYIASALRDKYPDDQLHVLIAKSNSGNFTYDGIETGAERVTHEIEESIADLERDGSKIKKISMLGYSLGGLVARYSIGLLHSNGWLDRLEPINFTTFASPHLGVRTPILGYQSHLWNSFGSHTLSMSGKQLFGDDTFRDTGRPILCVLADPSSIFMQALSRFKHRTLYANIINDRSAPYYTTFITKIDPYIDLNSININYVRGYAPTIIDPANPVSLKPEAPPPTLLGQIAGTGQTLLNNAPFYAAMSLLVPIGATAYLVNAGIQSVRSQNRIKLHESGQAGVGLGNYRIPLMIENARSAVGGTFASMNSSNSEYHAAGTDVTSDSCSNSSLDFHDEEVTNGRISSTDLKRTPSAQPKFPALKLSSDQIEMIENLDKAGFKKYAVHIQEVRHTHAAIVVRMKQRRFDEGKVVIKHWLDEEFEI
ncbi:MAG: hypothetical protein Q9195_006551 [Heterodermia aff. obscurata]